MADINEHARARLLLAAAGVVLIGLVLRVLARGYAIRKRIRGFVSCDYTPGVPHDAFADGWNSMARRTRGYGAI